MISDASSDSDSVMQWDPNVLCDGISAEDRVTWLVENYWWTIEEARAWVMMEFPAQFEHSLDEDSPELQMAECRRHLAATALEELSVKSWDAATICDGFSADDRVIWLVATLGLQEDAAKRRVVQEFPDCFGVRWNPNINCGGWLSESRAAWVVENCILSPCEAQRRVMREYMHLFIESDGGELDSDESGKWPSGGAKRKSKQLRMSVRVFSGSSGYCLGSVDDLLCCHTVRQLKSKIQDRPEILWNSAIKKRVEVDCQHLMTREGYKDLHDHTTLRDLPGWEISGLPPEDRSTDRVAEVLLTELPYPNAPFSTVTRSVAVSLTSGEMLFVPGVMHGMRAMAFLHLLEHSKPLARGFAYTLIEEDRMLSDDDELIGNHFSAVVALSKATVNWYMQVLDRTVYHTGLRNHDGSFQLGKVCLLHDGEETSVSSDQCFRGLRLDTQWLLAQHFLELEITLGDCLRPAGKPNKPFGILVSGEIGHHVDGALVRTLSVRFSRDMRYPVFDLETGDFLAMSTSVQVLVLSQALAGFAQRRENIYGNGALDARLESPSWEEAYDTFEVRRK